MDFDTTVKVAVYRATADFGSPPLLEAVAEKVGATPAAIKQAYGRLRASRLLLLERDGSPSGWLRPSRASHGTSGNGEWHRILRELCLGCSGIPAALRRPGLVRSRCDTTIPYHVCGRSGPGEQHCRKNKLPSFHGMHSRSPNETQDKLPRPRHQGVDIMVLAIDTHKLDQIFYRR